MNIEDKLTSALKEAKLVLENAIGELSIDDWSDLAEDVDNTIYGIDCILDGDFLSEHAMNAIDERLRSLRLEVSKAEVN